MLLLKLQAPHINMAKQPKFQALTGLHDILPKDQGYFKEIQKTVEKIAKFYNFKKIDTPIIEQAELFSKGVGAGTDIVDKEMYVFRTKGRDLVALRPEGTAPIVRSYIQHGMHSWPQPVKLWYIGPFFRYERPQAGRTRQFHQFGLEVLGEESPVIDAYLVQISLNILKKLGFKNLTIHINSIGCPECRKVFEKKLVSYLRSHKQALCSNCKERIKKNPLRVFDCKEEKCQRVMRGAPQILDHLCEECHNHFKEVLEFLDELEIPFNLNPYLVRGLDYYTKTVFEIEENSEKGKEQGALIGGGRYDKLVELLGGQETPACGMAGGIERIVGLMKATGKKPKRKKSADVFLAQLGKLAKRKSLKILEDFRKSDIKVADSLGRDSLKSQLKIADKLGVKYVLILGQKEALNDKIVIKDMEKGKQKTVKLDDLVKEIKKSLKK